MPAERRLRLRGDVSTPPGVPEGILTRAQDHVTTTAKWLSKHTLNASGVSSDREEEFYMNKKPTSIPFRTSEAKGRLKEF